MLPAPALRHPPANAVEHSANMVGKSVNVVLRSGNEAWPPASVVGRPVGVWVDGYKLFLKKS